MMSNSRWSENRIFWVFITLHLVIWTLVPSLTNHNLPIDVIEGLAWGNEGLWGYHKHPPLSPWLMDLFATVSNSSDWAQYLLSQLSVCAAFIGMWYLAKEFLSPLKALISVLLLEGVYYHGYASPEFNANIVLLPFWSLSILAFYKAVETRKLVWWVTLGAAAALAVLGKYFTGFLLISMLGYLVATEKGRSQFKSVGPYAALVVLLILLMPHLFWMIEAKFATLSYGVNRASGTASTELKHHITYPLKFFISQLVLLIPLLLMLATFGLKRDRSAERSG
ncbi:MAG: glycosyltransferase family 39 protein, partial [Sneathiella sp.]|nr:glycosyltransferase family 39 protein [Sneathiella sp.]